MKVTLVMATTVNGFVAGPGDDTEWVKDFDLFYKTVADWGVCVMGKRTYNECVKYDVFPYKGALNIVMTHDKTLLNKKEQQVIYTDASPKQIIEMAKEKGFDKLLVIGGGHVNGSFLKEGLIDEIILDVHPMIMANGIKLFESEFPNVNLKLVSFKQINHEVLQVKYTILR